MTNISFSHPSGQVLPVLHLFPRVKAPFYLLLMLTHLAPPLQRWLDARRDDWQEYGVPGNQSGAYQLERCGLWSGVENSETSPGISLNLSLQQTKTSIRTRQLYWIYEKEISRGIICKLLYFLFRRNASRNIGLSQSRCCGRVKEKDDRLILVSLLTASPSSVFPGPSVLDLLWWTRMQWGRLLWSRT